MPYVFHPLETNSMPEEQEKKDVVNATEPGKDSGLETGWTIIWSTHYWDLSANSGTF